MAALRQLFRVLVAFYLFLSGFGHFMYFWKTGDFGIRRFIQVIVPILLYTSSYIRHCKCTLSTVLCVQVLLRLNLFTVLVAVVMGSAYEQYYFPPLVSFWFVVLYVVMATWPRLTRQTVMGEGEG